MPIQKIIGVSFTKRASSAGNNIFVQSETQFTTWQKSWTVRPGRVVYISKASPIKIAYRTSISMLISSAQTTCQFQTALRLQNVRARLLFARSHPLASGAAWEKRRKKKYWKYVVGTLRPTARQGLRVSGEISRLLHVCLQKLATDVLTLGHFLRRLPNCRCV